MLINKETSYHYAKYLWMHLFLYWIKDAFIVYHSPAWCKKKSEFTLSPNDFNFNENHYFDNYINNVESIFWTEDSLINSIRGILNKKSFSVIYIITTDVAEIIWFDVTQVINVLKKDFLDVDFIYLQWQAIGWDLYDWYKDTLYNTLLNINTYNNNLVKKNPNSLNIFWYFFHRYEWDFFWDYNEIKSILNEIWISLEIFFPWKNTYTSLSKSLYISNKTIIFNYLFNDDVINLFNNKFNQNINIVNLPIWINNTINFIKRIKKLFLISEIDINNYIEIKLKKIIPKINLLSQVLLWKKFWIVWDSQKLIGFLDLYLDIWMVPKFLIILDSNDNILNDIDSLLNHYNFLEDVNIFINIDRNEINSIINNEKYDLDILLWSSIEKAHLKLDIKFLEVFFPMITKHFINEYSYLWFNWVLNILTDTYNLLNKLEYYNLSNSLWSLMWDFTFYHNIDD